MTLFERQATFPLSSDYIVHCTFIWDQTPAVKHHPLQCITVTKQHFISSLSSLKSIKSNTFQPKSFPNVPPKNNVFLPTQQQDTICLFTSRIAFSMHAVQSMAFPWQLSVVLKSVWHCLALLKSLETNPWRPFKKYHASVPMFVLPLLRSCPQTHQHAAMCCSGAQKPETISKETEQDPGHLPMLISTSALGFLMRSIVKVLAPVTPN